MTTDFVLLAQHLRHRAVASAQRRAVVVSGERAWCLAQARELPAILPGGHLALVSDQVEEGFESLPASHSAGLLGSELDGLVFDAWAGFDPDAFGRVSGALRGGGLLLLLTPPLARWARYADPENERIAVALYGADAVGNRFLSRLIRNIRASAEVVLYEQGRAAPTLPPAAPAAAAAPLLQGECRTPDQRLAVEAVEKVATGHRDRPLVLTSDRGRGKSAALGLAAAHLLRRGMRRIVVSAPRLDAAEQVFAHAARLLPEAERSRGGLRLEAGELVFVAPDELARGSQGADLVLVDEAAAIPAPLLERFLARYHRIVFASTIHGYEGTGRGFTVRFQQRLARHAPGWRALHMTQPIRWAANDPIERWVFRTLLLDAEAAPDAALAAAHPADCTIRCLDRDALAADEPLLKALFGLLVLAHYRTRPRDLRHLLDGPNVRVWAMLFEGYVVATALTAREGGFEAALAQAIWAGTRRPRGHLIPQSLAAFAGLEQAPQCRGDRVMRIAVHPAARGRGLGSALLAAVSERAAGEGMDYVGSSFGATADLLRFWRGAAFEPVWVGLSREASSGTHSAIVLRPLSQGGQGLFAAAQSRFGPTLLHLLGDTLKDLEPELVLTLLATSPPVPVHLPPQEWSDILAFAYANRGYESASLPIWKLTAAALGSEAARGLGDIERSVLIARVLQRVPWPEVVARSGLAGRKEGVQALRRAVRRLYDQCAPAGLPRGLPSGAPASDG